MILDAIERAKRKLFENNIAPVWLRMSPGAHDLLVAELNHAMPFNSRGTMVFEVCGLKVEIDGECPAMGAYVEGKEHESH